MFDCVYELGKSININSQKALTVQILSDCNLRCCYCFARGSQESIHKRMSLDNIVYIANFCRANRIPQIRITGGEPMLHPEILEIIKLLNRSGIKIHIFSNFTVRNIVKTLPSGIDISFLANVNMQETYEEVSYNTVLDNLAAATTKGYIVSLGCNIYTFPFDLQNHLQLAKRFKISRLRLSPTNQIMGENNLVLTDHSLQLWLSEFDTLYSEANAAGIQISFDCPIPFCMIQKDKLQFMQEKLNLKGICSFGERILPDMTIGHCYVTDKTILREPIQTYRCYDELRRDILRKVRTLKKPMEQCSLCEHFKNSRCDGGCLGNFAE